ncbi:hypothetical protein SBRY_30489 [Actinacidiphila bryophytorum]|uniref:Uncharacterized protein n=1 Tax=Actinacidiphila bryophytorum TaxID=1436133 RepID=A0A9W4H180_9ACTN|nr:hypothetical protein SBRY_30489 [Actinacidiphila bryophytorum]
MDRTDVARIPAGPGRRPEGLRSDRGGQARGVGRPGRRDGTRHDPRPGRPGRLRHQVQHRGPGFGRRLRPAGRRQGGHGADGLVGLRRPAHLGARLRQGGQARLGALPDRPQGQGRPEERGRQPLQLLLGDREVGQQVRCGRLHREHRRPALLHRRPAVHRPRAGHRRHQGPADGRHQPRLHRLHLRHGRRRTDLHPVLGPGAAAGHRRDDAHRPAEGLQQAHDAEAVRPGHGRRLASAPWSGRAAVRADEARSDSVDTGPVPAGSVYDPHPSDSGEL